VLGEFDPNGTVTATRKYDVYGAVRSSTGTSTSKHKFVGCLGHMSEDETGLIYMRARYMDPVTGRFISEDPGYQGLNWYAYANGNPVGMIDSGGRASEWAVGMVIAWFLYLTGKFISSENMVDMRNDAKLAMGVVAAILLAEATDVDSPRSYLIREAKELCTAFQQASGIPCAASVVAFYAGYSLFLLYACEWCSDFEK
jgi:RHS repeat-associated protein